jgi:pimeloyl-ACP methyl ester carboxylesterase
MVEVEGEGPSILFVHGLGGTSNSFQTLLGALEGFRRLRVDLPGSGRSPRPFSPLSIDGFVGALEDVIATLGAAPAHVVGHSMGALVCQHLASRRPELVKSLALFGPVVEPNEGMRQRLKDRAVAARRDGLLGIADAALGGLSSTSKSANPVAAAFVRESHMRQEEEGFAQTCEALAAGQPADLRFLRCRTLIVTGDEDPIAPPSVVRALGDKIKGSTVNVLPHCGHWTPIERPEECARFLSQHVRAAEGA